MNDSEQYIELLNRAHKTLVAELRRLAEPHDINRGELPVLVRLLRAGDGVSQKVLREDLPLSKSTLSKTIASLSEKELVTKEPSETDGRVKLIYLTDKGRNLDPTIKEIGNGAATKMLADFDPVEKEQLANYLERIEDNLNS